MNVPHSVSWREAQAANKLVAKALEVYPDEHSPACDRSALRAKWASAVNELRKMPRGYLMDRHVKRLEQPSERAA